MTKITSIPTIGPALYPRVEIWALMLAAVIFIFNTFSERVLKFPPPGGAKALVRYEIYRHNCHRSKN